MPCGIALLVALGFALGKAGGIAVVIGSFFSDGCIIAFLIGAALRHSRGKTRVIGSLFRNGSVVAPAVNARRRNDEQHAPEREPKGQHKAPGVFRHRRQPEPLPAFQQFPYKLAAAAPTRQLFVFRRLRPGLLRSFHGRRDRHRRSAASICHAAEKVIHVSAFHILLRRHAVAGCDALHQPQHAAFFSGHVQRPTVLPPLRACGHDLPAHLLQPLFQLCHSVIERDSALFGKLPYPCSIRTRCTAAPVHLGILLRHLSAPHSISGRQKNAVPYSM